MKNTFDIQIDGKEVYKRYLEILSSHKNIIIEMELLATNYNLITNKLIIFLQQYIDEYIEKPEFAIIFDELQKSDNRNEYLDSLGITPEYLKQHLKEYLWIYKPIVGLKNNRFAKVFENIIKNYEAYLRGPKKVDKVVEVRPIIEEFIKSEYGIERFCIKYNIRPKDFKSYIPIIKKDGLLYKRFSDSFELKEKLKYEHIEDDISVILDYIYKLGDDFCTIDLFQITKYGPSELITFADQYLPNDKLKLFRKHIGRSYRDFLTRANFMNNARIEGLINNDYIIKVDDTQVATTKEFRIEVINYLREKDIPINLDIFYIACIRHYKNNLINKIYR